MTAVDTDVFWRLEVSLCEINYAAVSVPTVNKIVDDCILVAFTNQFIRDDNPPWLSTESSSRGIISSSYKV